jgi:hypothetical protein
MCLMVDELVVAPTQVIFFGRQHVTPSTRQPFTLTISQAFPATRILSSPPNLNLVTSSAISSSNLNRSAGAKAGSWRDSVRRRSLWERLVIVAVSEG